MQAAQAAILRDLGEWYGWGGTRAVDAYNSWGHRVLGVFARLGSAMVWRSVTLEPSPRGSGRALWQCDQAPAENWLQHILEPWFAGTAYLNAEVLSGVLQAVLAEPDVRLLGSETDDAEVLLALQRYAAARKESSRAKRGTAPRQGIRKKWWK